MTLLQCEMCCGELEISPDKSVGVCKYCGSTYTIPKEIEKKGNLFNRANYLRQNCNFDKAINVYESILAENCEDADALWGLVLCRYGIEFVEDPKTGARIPTCHRASRTSILLDPDFKSAMQYADAEKRAVYYENATRIDQIQKAILSLSDTQEKYDVFICYKETDENGDRTIDSVLAQELYNELTKMKLKTFFARKTLEGKVGSSYEPIIYSALNSARVMIVLGTKPEHFEATWVKNEWSRYLDFMKDDSNKHIIPAYRDMSAYQLPEEFMSIQAQDMSRIGFMLDLCDGVKKLLRKDETVESMAGAPISKDSLYSRAMVFLGNREFYKAVDYFDKVLDIDPQYARAYWGSLLAAYQCVTNNELINCTSDDWTDDARLKNALQFASAEEREIYEDTLERRVENFRKLANAALEKKDFEKCRVWCDKYTQHKGNDGNIWWLCLLATHEACNSNELFDNCYENAQSIVDAPEYLNAVQYSIPEESMMYEKTAQKIEAAVGEKNRIRAYNEGRSHMQTAVSALKHKRENDTIAYWNVYKEEVSNMRSLQKKPSKFYGNNVFSFLMHLVILALPAYVLAFMAFYEDGSTMDLMTSFVTILCIGTAISLLVNVCRFGSNAKSMSEAAKICRKTSEKLEKNQRSAADTARRQKQAEKLLGQYEEQNWLTIEQIAEKQADFDAIYENLN